jgi:dethiobiotin synthetase
VKFIAVTGTGTDIGKTIATAALASCAMQAGLRVAVVKPVQTGVRPGEPGDLATVGRLTGCTDLFEFVRYAEPLAPATAARRVGEYGPNVTELAERIAALTSYDLVLIEGAGGALVRLNQSDETLLDLLVALEQHDVGSYGTHRLEIALVTSAGLGALHNVAATSRAMEEDGCGPQHIVIGSWPSEPGLAERCNLDDLLDYAVSGQLRGAVPEGAGTLDRDSFAKLAMGWLTPTLGGELNMREFVSSHYADPTKPIH